MATPQTWTCDCGQMQIRVGLQNAARVVCYCRDCRALAHLLGRPDLLSHAGGIEAVQTLPERLRFLSGKDQLACVNMTGRDRLRWFAKCCNTPLGTTLHSRFIPYISVISKGFENVERIGPVKAHANRKHALARIEGDMGSMNRVLAGMAGRAAQSFLTLGPWRSPFRTKGGAPVVAVSRLSDTERTMAYNPPPVS